MSKKQGKFGKDHDNRRGFYESKDARDRPEFSEAEQ